MYRDSQHVRERQSHQVDADIIDLSTFDDLAQEARQISVEQLTKSEQLQPWNGQGLYGGLYSRLPTPGWHSAHIARPGAMTEPLQSGSHAMRMERTSSQNHSNADSGYVSQLMSSEIDRFDQGIAHLGDGTSVPCSLFGAKSTPGGPWRSTAQTAVTEIPARSTDYKRKTRKPSLTACIECGRLPKNHSDARKHAETHLKRFKCMASGCTRKDGFSTLNDLERHRKSVHSLQPTVGSPLGYICRACMHQSDGKGNKFWPRRDNFKAHIKRKHTQWDEAQLLDISKTHRPDDAMTADLDGKSVASIVAGPRGLTCADHNEGAWHETYTCDSHTCQHSSQLPQQDDFAELFTDSGLQEDTLAAMGSHALENGMPYTSEDYWTMGLDGVHQGTSVARAPDSSYTQVDMQQYYSGNSSHTQQSPTDDKSGGLHSHPDHSHDANAFFGLSKTQLLSQPRFQLGNHQCPYCEKSKERKCDLKKHMKRHTRPYGCTFTNCSKRLGSRNDWKRHELSQHRLRQQPVWKCGRHRLPEHGGTVCMRRPFNRVESLAQHLRSDEHGMRCSREIAEACLQCRMGRDARAHFWCGFCRCLIDQPDEDASSWEYRSQHIGDHFDKDNKHIDDWVCVEQNKAKKYITLEEPKAARAPVRAGNGHSLLDGDLPVWSPEDPGILTLDAANPNGPRSMYVEGDEDAKSISDGNMMENVLA